MGSGSHVAILIVRKPCNLGVRSLHDMRKFGTNLFLGPEEALEILYPLEIADSDACGISQDVGNHPNTSLEKDVVSLGSGWPIGRLGDQACLDALGVANSDLTLGCRRNEHITRDFKHI